MKKLWSKVSLKFKLIMMVMIVVGISGMSAFFQFWGIFKDIEKDKMELLHTSAQSISNAIAAQFYERYGDIQAFAGNPTVVNFDVKGIPTELDKYVKLYGIYNLILVVDTNGRYVASNKTDPSGKAVDIKTLEKVNYADSPWFKAVMENKTTDDKEKGFADTYFEEFHVDPLIKLAFGENYWGNSFSSAIKDQNGKVIGVITNRADMKWVYEEFQRSYKTLKSTGNVHTEFALINGEGVLIAEYDPSVKGDDIKQSIDFETLGKLNLVQLGLGAAVHLSQGHSGFEINEHKRKHVELVSGYQFVEDSKWPKSLRWGVIVRNNLQEVMHEVSQAKAKFYLYFALTLFISVFIGYWVAQFIEKKIVQISSQLAQNSQRVGQSSQLIAGQSAGLSEATTEQAAAIQETMSAVDEIGAMVEKNADAAKKSREVSSMSQKASTDGQNTVQEMLKSIADISAANDEISTQMELNNQQINEVVKLIGDIGNKTKVINEIVFQTKLLSFNASVEAARAGEYGKGFAVVAEEVGNLATMSGNAAKEITQMLDASIQKAESIVKETEIRVETLVKNAKEKVTVGNRTAQECNEALAEISKNVNAVDALVLEITVASQEQAHGIREISKAIGQLDVATQQNATTAQESSKQSVSLNGESQELNSVVTELLTLIHGEKPDHQQQRKESQPVNSTSNKKSFSLKMFKGDAEKSSSKKAKNLSETSEQKKPKLKVLSKKQESKKTPVRPQEPPVQKVAVDSSVVHPEGQKMISGSDVIPSSNDPRFEDI